MFKIAIVLINLITLYLISKMATKADLKAVLDELQTSVGNVAGDVDRLADKIESGDFIPDELVAQARSIADNLKAVADKTPEDAETPVEPEGPVVDPQFPTGNDQITDNNADGFR